MGPSRPSSSSRTACAAPGSSRPETILVLIRFGYAPQVAALMFSGMCISRALFGARAGLVQPVSKLSAQQQRMCIRSVQGLMLAACGLAEEGRARGYSICMLVFVTHVRTTGTTHRSRSARRASATSRSAAGRSRQGVRGAHLNPLGLFLRTSTPRIWRILRACRPF